MHAVLQYSYVADYLERREALRPAHLTKAWEAVERGDLLLGGAVGNGPFTGLLVFSGGDPEATATAFAEADPYVTGGLVASWSVSPWRTVVGRDAASPVRPEAR